MMLLGKTSDYSLGTVRSARRSDRMFLGDRNSGYLKLEDRSGPLVLSGDDALGGHGEA